jgi:hypothetical protein
MTLRSYTTLTDSALYRVIAVLHDPQLHQNDPDLIPRAAGGHKSRPSDAGVKHLVEL